MKSIKQNCRCDHRSWARQGSDHRCCYVHVLAACCTLLCFVGCQTSGGGSWLGGWRPKSLVPGTPDSERLPAPPPVQANAGGDQADANQGRVASAGVDLARRIPGSNQLVGFVTGKTTQDLDAARKLYQQGDAMFNQAKDAPKATREKLFKRSAKFFQRAAEEAPGSGLEQDALFMQGESLFFANELNDSRDALENLQKKFPRNRHSDRAAARLFSISKYWIDIDKAGEDRWYTLNLFDDKRPMRDAVGHAVRVLDQIRYDDPTGRLADDATMAAAAEHIRNKQYDKADEFLTDLRETFTDSDHQFIAHLLGIRCKLEVYRGPVYSEKYLDEASTLLQQTRRRFPNELREQKYAELVARAAAEIEYHKAEKLAYRANLREKQREYGAAAAIYQEILRDFPNAPQADRARDVLERIGSLPAKPSRPLAFMTKIFPSARQTSPLELQESKQPATDDSEESGGSFYR